ESHAADAHAVRPGTLEAEPAGEQLHRSGGVAAVRGHLRQCQATPAGRRMMGLARRRGRELDQDTARALRVEEADHPGQPGAWLLVDEREARAAGPLELARDVGRLEADVVQALAALLEELGDAAGGIDRLEELDLAASDRQQRRLDALVRDRRL